MIKITFEASSVAELRSIISEYLGAPKPEKPAKKQTEKVADPEPEVEPPADEPPAITIEDIRTLVLSGQIPKPKVKELLGKYKVQRITEVPETDYKTFFDELAALKGE